MSSIGHLFVGAAASRYALTRMSGARTLAMALLLTCIAIAPDLDLWVLPALGVPDSLTLGHRGATHSLVVALSVVLIVTLLAKAVRLPARRIAVGAFLAIGSHALLDSLTRGPGVAWLWPFTSMRFPTFPILPMPPLDHVLGASGLRQLLAEGLVFSPFLAYAIFARPKEMQKSTIASDASAGTIQRASHSDPPRGRRAVGALGLVAAIALLLLLLVIVLPIFAGQVKPSTAFGVWSGQPWEPENLDAVTTLLGRPPSIFLTYQSWSTRKFHADDMQEIASRGAAHVVTWGPDGYTLKSIATGSHDAYVRAWAAGAAAWGGTIYLRPMHEMNGDWYAWGRGVNGNTSVDFVDAWRHLHDIFLAEGATNVKWVWSPNVRYGSLYPFADLYPGDAYVDWLGLDGYNWGSDPHLQTPTWQSFTDIFAASYDEITEDVAPSKPVMVVETASSEHGGDKADWIRHTFVDELPTFPKIRAVIWFNEAAGASDFRINSSPASLAAFRGIFDSAAYQGRLP